MAEQELAAIAQALVAQGKGILAADESTNTIARRFASVAIESTEASRRNYRELLFTTPGIEAFISGVIMYDETIRQADREGTTFPTLLAARGIIPGIKVDKGAHPLAGFPGERITEGLDGLRERLLEYRRLGARFAKWRAVIAIGSERPTRCCLHANAHALARYAALCQEADLVPIVEPEVLMDGDHEIDRCEAITTATLDCVFAALREHRVFYEGVLLKPNMVTAGSQCPRQAGIAEVATATVRCLRRAVPAAVPGIVFLSGGQSAVLATEHLNAMNALGPHPWPLSFSYGRALQDPVLAAWRGRAENRAQAQQLFYHRAKCNAMARAGRYTLALEEAVYMNK